jgi:hypothetical protein
MSDGMDRIPAADRMTGLVRQAALSWQALSLIARLGDKGTPGDGAWCVQVARAALLGKPLPEAER